METGKADTRSCSRGGCLDDKHIRKLLPCFHVFCFEYLNEFNRGSNKKYSCPRCRVRFVVPKGDLSNLPDNFFGQRLEVLNRVLLDGELTGESEKERRREIKMVCNVCCTASTMENGTERTAVAFCIECNQCLCETCFGCHKRMRLSSSHQVLGASEFFQRVTEVFSRGSRHCDVHPSEMERLYCWNCEVPMCTECYAEEWHREHSFVPVERMSEEARTRIMDELNNIEGSKLRAREFLELIDGEIKRFGENVGNVEEEIKETKQRMLDAVSTDAQRLREELKTHNDECIRTTSIVENEARRECRELDQLVHTTRKVTERVPDSATPQLAESFSRIMQQLTISPGFREWQEFWLKSPPRADQFQPVIDEKLNNDMDALSGQIGELQVIRY